MTQDEVRKQLEAEGLVSLQDGLEGVAKIKPGTYLTARRRLDNRLSVGADVPDGAIYIKDGDLTTYGPFSDMGEVTEALADIAVKDQYRTLLMKLHDLRKLNEAWETALRENQRDRLPAYIHKMDRLEAEIEELKASMEPGNDTASPDQPEPQPEFDSELLQRLKHMGLHCNEAAQMLKGELSPPLEWRHANADLSRLYSFLVLERYTGMSKKRFIEQFTKNGTKINYHSVRHNGNGIGLFFFKELVNCSVNSS